MKLKRLISLILCLVLVFSTVSFSVYGDEDGGGSDSSSSDSDDDDDGGGDGGDTYIIDSFNTYYNYFYLNDTEFNYIDLYSLNNRDETAYWRPKYDDVSVAIKEYVEWNDRRLKVHKQVFDVEWKEIDKTSLPTSRALEILGYDFLLYKESVSSESGVVDRVLGYKSPITAPYFIMNIYKALGIELYDIYFIFDQDESTCGVYITRTNPDSYWELFLNDHPIDYAVYNDVDVTDTVNGNVLTGADAIAILSQMLDFYGEPTISKQEENLLLQVYGDDVPLDLEDSYRLAWSYLKCRGIIGEEELSYRDNLSFDDMMELLMRVKDVNSRTNFKEVQITTNLDNTFIENGYYEHKATLKLEPEVFPESVDIDWSSSERIDFLIEISNATAFKYQDTNELNRNIFISKGPNHYDDPIPGSIYEGIVNNKYYHFSVPRQYVDGGAVFINSNKGGDYPLNYRLNQGSGGIYSAYTMQNDSVIFDTPLTFENIMPDSLYVDLSRLKRIRSDNTVHAAPSSKNVKATFDTTLIDIPKSIEAVKKLGGDAEEITSGDKKMLEVTISTSIVGSAAYDIHKKIGRILVLKDEYSSQSKQGTNVIMGLTGDRLLVEVEKAKDIGAIENFKSILDKDLLILYASDGDITIVDNKNKIIQKGNMYMQIRESQPLFVVQDGKYMVDFRALYGTAEVGFNVGTDQSTGGTTITMYNNSIFTEEMKTEKTTYQHKIGDYFVYSTDSYSPYITNKQNSNSYGGKYFNQENKLHLAAVDLLFKYKSSSNSTNLSSNDIEQVLLPFSSSNPLGNYVMYTEWDSSKSIMDTYLVFMTHKNTTTPLTDNKKYDEMFKYIPEATVFDKYDANIVKLGVNEVNRGIIDVPGVGYCYNLKILSSDADKTSFMSGFLQHTNLLPFGIEFDSNVPKLLNFNMNYYTDDMYKNLTGPDKSSFAINGASPAPIGIQTWFTNSEILPNISVDTLKSSSNTSFSQVLYWGNVRAWIDNNGKLKSFDNSLEINYALNDVIIQSLGRLKGSAKDANAYQYPGMYSVLSSNFKTTVSTAKAEVSNNTIDKKLIRLQEFFDQFKEITFKDFIQGLDNSMSIMYYIITRVVPLIILCLLMIMLMLSMVSDVRLVQLFCEKVFDPVRFLTFGNYNIQTVNNRFLIFSLIGALTIMGIIQAGNLEKIIMFVIRFYYSATLFFD